MKYYLLFLTCSLAMCAHAHDSNEHQTPHLPHLPSFLPSFQSTRAPDNEMERSSGSDSLPRSMRRAKKSSRTPSQTFEYHSTTYPEYRSWESYLPSKEDVLARQHSGEFYERALSEGSPQGRFSTHPQGAESVQNAPSAFHPQAPAQSTLQERFPMVSQGAESAQSPFASFNQDQALFQRTLQKRLPTLPQGPTPVRSVWPSFDQDQPAGAPRLNLRTDPWYEGTPPFAPRNAPVNTPVYAQALKPRETAQPSHPIRYNMAHVPLYASPCESYGWTERTTTSHTTERTYTPPVVSLGMYGAQPTEGLQSAPSNQTLSIEHASTPASMQSSFVANPFCPYTPPTEAHTPSYDVHARPTPSAQISDRRKSSRLNKKGASYTFVPFVQKRRPATTGKRPLPPRDVPISRTSSVGLPQMSFHFLMHESPQSPDLAPITFLEENSPPKKKAKGDVSAPLRAPFFADENDVQSAHSLLALKSGKTGFGEGVHQGPFSQDDNDTKDTQPLNESAPAPALEYSTPAPTEFSDTFAPLSESTPAPALEYNTPVSTEFSDAFSRIETEPSVTQALPSSNIVGATNTQVPGAQPPKKPRVKKSSQARRRQEEEILRQEACNLMEEIHQGNLEACNKAFNAFYTCAAKFGCQSADYAQAGLALVAREALIGNTVMSYDTSSTIQTMFNEALRRNQGAYSTLPIVKWILDTPVPQPRSEFERQYREERPYSALKKHHLSVDSNVLPVLLDVYAQASPRMKSEILKDLRESCNASTPLQWITQGDQEAFLQRVLQADASPASPVHDLPTQNPASPASSLVRTAPSFVIQDEDDEYGSDEPFSSPRSEDFEE